MNQVILMGRMARDPELKHTNSGTAVCSFTVAVSRKKKDDPADFINCVAWQNAAEFISKYFGKGQLIAIVGRWQTRNYTDKNGDKKRVDECVVDSVYFGGDMKKTTSEVKAEEFEELDDTGDLPF